MVSFASLLVLWISLGSALSIPVPKPGTDLRSQRVTRDESPITSGNSPFDPELLQIPSQGGHFAGGLAATSSFEGP
ncbi:hypothetical protein K439DRAFT_1632502 [Ramaria rubella]|nr:hypothetical protein K439DRAFT_1632502 [Ramaria rubella]